MRTIFKMFLVLALSFSFASADMIKEVSRDVIMKIMNSPTKRIVDQEVGEFVVMYKYYPDDDDFWSRKGEVIQKGVEKDSRGKEYQYVIVHMPSTLNKGKYFKFIMRPFSSSTLIIANGDFKGNPNDKEHSFFNMTPGASWVDDDPCQPYGGCGKKRKSKFAAL